MVLVVVRAVVTIPRVRSLQGRGPRPSFSHAPSCASPRTRVGAAAYFAADGPGDSFAFGLTVPYTF